MIFLVSGPSVLVPVVSAGPHSSEGALRGDVGRLSPVPWGPAVVPNQYQFDTLGKHPPGGFGVGGVDVQRTHAAQSNGP